MKEEDIRPQALYNRYLGLAAEDVQQFFSNATDFVEIDCPACAGTSSHIAFEKLSFNYRLCEDCASLFVSPRPSPSMINAFYQNGASVHFWATDFFKQTAEARRARMFRPRALFVEEWVRKAKPNGKRFADIGSGYGIFLEEMQAREVFDDIIGIEPSPPLAQVCRQGGYTIVEDTIEQCRLDGAPLSVMTSFEFMEHAFDPSVFLKAVYNLLAPDGLLIFTTLTVSGFDIQVLWEHSKSAHPPHHLNLLSVEGIRRLISRCGFHLQDLETPGELDVDIVRNVLAEQPDISIDRFSAQIAKNDDSSVRSAFQSFLKTNCLSSHLRAVVSK